MDIDLTLRNATPAQIFAMLKAISVSQPAVLSPSPSAPSAAVASSTELAARIARLKARPFKNDEARRVIDEWQRMRDSGESQSYSEFARRCGNGARQGFGQTVATVERAARAIFGVPLFAREKRRVNDKVDTFYAANPLITNDDEDEVLALAISF